MAVLVLRSEARWRKLADMGEDDGSASTLAELLAEFIWLPAQLQIEPKELPHDHLPASHRIRDWETLGWQNTLRDALTLAGPLIKPCRSLRSCK